MKPDFGKNRLYTVSFPIVYEVV